MTTWKAERFAVVVLILTTIFMVALLSNSWLKAKLSSPGFKLLGDLSFPLYLVHVIVIVGPGSYIYTDIHQAGHPIFAVFAAAVTVTALSALLALIMMRIDRWWLGTLNKAAHILYRP